MRKTRRLYLLRSVVIAVLAATLLVAPGVFAGHLLTSPAENSQRTNPQDPDEVAYRGITERSSLGPDDIPVGVVGWATGDVLGTDGEVHAIHAVATGNVLGTNGEVDAVHAVATGEAAGVGSEVVGIRAVVTGTPTGQDADVVGIAGVARATSGNAIGVRGRSDSPNGTGVAGIARATSGGTGVAGIARATSGEAVGVFGLTFSLTAGAEFFG
jgi:hypothetical protein